MIYYTILEESSKESLQNLVFRNMELGWEPIGGVSIAPEYDASGLHAGYRYTQAMIRRQTTTVQS